MGRKFGMESRGGEGAKTRDTPIQAQRDTQEIIAINPMKLVLVQSGRPVHPNPSSRTWTKIPVLSWMI